MNLIRVELDVLDRTERKMQEQKDLYRQLYSKLFLLVDDTGRFWSGKDQEAFIRQIHGFEEDFDKMYQLIDTYCTFLKKSSQAYRICQDEAERSASQLIQ